MGIVNDRKLVWHIGKEGSTSTNLEAPPFKAFFTWLHAGQIERFADFTEPELQTEITRLRSAGEDTTPYEQALKQLHL